MFAIGFAINVFDSYAQMIQVVEGMCSIDN